jgi:hypothetical protein
MLALVHAQALLGQGPLRPTTLLAPPLHSRATWEGLWAALPVALPVSPNATTPLHQTPGCQHTRPLRRRKRSLCARLRPNPLMCHALAFTGTGKQSNGSYEGVTALS